MSRGASKNKLFDRQESFGTPTDLQPKGKPSIVTSNEDGESLVSSSNADADETDGHQSNLMSENVFYHPIKIENMDV